MQHLASLVGSPHCNRLAGRALAARRRGAVAVLAAFCLVMLLGAIALAVDIGRLAAARTELQRSADAAALAACGQLQRGRGANGIPSETIRLAGAKYAKLNTVAQQGPSIDLNNENSADGGLVVGFVANSCRSDSPLILDDPLLFNSVQVQVERGAKLNGEIPLFFSAIWGLHNQALKAKARASFLQDFRGFRIPEKRDGRRSKDTVPIMPITVREDTWLEAVAGLGTDEVSWDSEKHALAYEPDGQPELKIFPSKNTSGNFGLLDIGSSQSSNSTLQRQIREGLSQADLDYHGGALELDEKGELRLSGNPGTSVGVVDGVLHSTVGQTRILPVFRSVEGGGNPAIYTIVGFAGVRILEIELRTGEKYVMVQPTPVIVEGGIPAETNEGVYSKYVYSPVQLTD